MKNAKAPYLYKINRSSVIAVHSVKDPQTINEESPLYDITSLLECIIYTVALP